MLFQLLSTIEVNLVQSAYLCVIFHVKYQKLPFLAVSRGFNLISNSWLNPRWRPRWLPLLVTSQASSSVTTHKIQLFRERLSEKVHATIPKGIVDGFEFTVLQRNLKEWHESHRRMFANAKGIKQQ